MPSASANAAAVRVPAGSEGRSGYCTCTKNCCKISTHFLSAKNRLLQMTDAVGNEWVGWASWVAPPDFHFHYKSLRRIASEAFVFSGDSNYICSIAGKSKDYENE